MPARRSLLTLEGEGEVELTGELARPGDEHGRAVVSLFTRLNNTVDTVEAQPFGKVAIVVSRQFCLL